MLAVGRMAEQREKVCAMHYMGTGLGLTASLHCLAAINGNGPIELDANPNPLRTELGELDLTIRNGHLKVPSGCGHGFLPDPAAFKAIAVASMDIS